MEKFIGKNEDLYEILGLPSRGSKENTKITAAAITKAYRKCALDCHPDKTDSKDDLKRFHKISAAYSVLKSDTAREAYDKTGKYSSDNQPLTSRQQDWTNLFRAMYDEVSEEEVKSFYSKYVGSKEEIEDLIQAYAKTKGDFAELVENYALFDNAKKGNVRRIKKILDKLIKEQKIKQTKRYVTTTQDKTLEEIEGVLAQERELAAKGSIDLEVTGIKDDGTEGIQ